MSRLRVRICMLLALVALATSVGCVVEPFNDQYYVDWQREPIRMSGYASAPNIEIEILAYHQRNQTWDVVATTRSTDNRVNFGGHRWYPWQYEFVVNDEIDSSCYISPSAGCHVSPGQTPLRLRFRQRRGRSKQLLHTFEEGGFECFVNSVSQDGRSAGQAIVECNSDDSPAITVWLLT